MKETTIYAWSGFCMGAAVFSVLILSSGYFDCEPCIKPDCHEAERLNRGEMYNPGIINSTLWTNGVFRTGSNYSFYCVWTEGRNNSEIADTEQHEIAHALVDIDYEHFCNHNNTSYEYRNFRR